MRCLNVTLDIGYSILFNFMECFIRMFGFDLYVVCTMDYGSSANHWYVT